MPARHGRALLLPDSSRDRRARRVARASQSGGTESCSGRSSRIVRAVMKPGLAPIPAGTATTASSMNAPDPIAHPDRVQDVGTTHHAPKDRVDAVEVRLRGMRDEILAAARCGTGERHADGAHAVADRIDFVAEHEPRPGSPPAIAARIAVLYDKVRDDA